MTYLRLGIYVLYVILGVVLAVRLLAAGPRWEMLSGFIFAAVLAGMGIYRLVLFARMRSGKQ